MAIPNRNANPENVVAAARTFLTTSSTAGRRRLLQSDHSARLFIRVLYNCRTQGKFRLHEFVVMPDHFHVLLTIDTGMTIERAVQLIKGGFSFRAGRELGMRSPVWQKGFSDRRITGVDEFERIRNYSHKNPVKQLLVKEAPQYPYSSAHYGFELDPAPVYLNPKLIAAVFRAAKSLPDKASRDAFFHAVSKAG